MKILLKLEYVFFFLIGILAFVETGISWWWFAAMFFLPDLSMLGYLAGSKSGAFLYNLFHHFAVGILCFIVGKYLNNDDLTVETLYVWKCFDEHFGFLQKFLHIVIFH